MAIRSVDEGQRITHVNIQAMAPRALEGIAGRAYTAIATAFPVCSSSDEFYFFPQVILPERDWARWDDFSDAKVHACADALAGFERELSSLGTDGMPAADRVDRDLLQQMLRSVREQLIEIAPHRSQPTFHLTLLAAGLAEALAAEGSHPWQERLRAAPAFLQRAAECLRDVPRLFCTLGLEMLWDLQAWLASLQRAGCDVGEVTSALQGFQAALKQVDVVEDYQLPEFLLEKLVAEHVGCGLGVEALLPRLQEELQAMEDLLARESARLAPGLSWVAAERQVPFVAAQGESLLALYRQELDAMEGHCRRQGLTVCDREGVALEVAVVPRYLAAIRAADAYAATPGHPPRGGRFFVMEHSPGGESRPGRSVEYRMTAAHEAWPGHHLLDASRWALDRPLRRPVESPLFYEGWACLAEEIMARTGYFAGPWDRFLLAKRRAERAARGLADLGLQSGRMTFDAAVQLLVRVGYRPEVAVSVIPKYLLRPGYQVCYTVGLQQALGLLDGLAGGEIGRFARTVLTQGEVGFHRLETIFAADMKRSQV